MSIHNVKYFIQKFESIPENKWCTNHYTIEDAHCALGHCGCIADGYQEGPLQTEEGLALKSLFPISRKTLAGGITAINDGEHPDYKQLTPKQRVLAALYDLSEKLIC